MTAVLWRWPDSAQVNRPVPKTKFYEHARVNTRLRDRFIAEVEQVTWAFKLTTSSVRLSPGGAVSEIQVFTVDAKPGQTVSKQVLEAIDRSVQTPVIFEERTRSAGQPGAGLDRVRTRAAHKYPGARGPVLSALFDGEWLPLSAERTPLPTSLDLGELLTRLVEPLLPLQRRPGEAMSDVLDRIASAAKLAREVAALEQRMKKEPQFNRKLELRNELLDRTKQYETLTKVDR